MLPFITIFFKDIENLLQSDRKVCGERGFGFMREPENGGGGGGGGAFGWDMKGGGELCKWIGKMEDGVGQTLEVDWKLGKQTSEENGKVEAFKTTKQK